MTQTFASLFSHLVHVEAFWQTEFDALERLYQESLRAAYKASYPNRRLTTPIQQRKIVQIPNYENIVCNWQTRADCMLAFRKAEITHIEADLTALAMAEDLPMTDDLICLDSCDGSSYHTQGFGANKYARNSVQFVADKAIFYGLLAEVREIDSHNVQSWSSGMMTYIRYGVFINTTEIGFKQLSYRHDIPMREWVKSCWKNGVNPRVYNPWLPHGYEESVGLDYFGGEISTE
jgi:hypothetical protein